MSYVLKATLLTFGACLAALADPVITYGGNAVAGNGVFSSVAGATTLDFNAGFPAGPITYATTGGGPHLVTGSLGGVYAAPADDNTQYLTLGPSAGSPVTITTSSLVNYFGFYLSTGDTYNVLQFYRGNTLLYTLGGAQFSTPVANGTASSYVNIRTANVFDRIVMSSNQNAFETDNHAFANVPEPTAISLFLAVGAGLLVRRRRSSTN